MTGRKTSQPEKSFQNSEDRVSNIQGCSLNPWGVLNLLIQQQQQVCSSVCWCIICVIVLEDWSIVVLPGTWKYHKIMKIYHLQTPAAQFIRNLLKVEYWPLQRSRRLQFFIGGKRGSEMEFYLSSTNQMTCWRFISLFSGLQRNTSSVRGVARGGGIPQPEFVSWMD